ncbi:MAG: flavin reductase [Flavobacteriales bacterium]|nr:flavin reductase [Flavobacteriales bacterium]
MNKISPGEIEPRLFYRLLSGIIGPRPIALVSSSDLNGEINLAPFSFFNVMSIQPPVLVFSPLRRLRTNTKKDTLNNVHEHKEVVINILGYNHVEQVSITGNDYDSDVNEFVKSGFNEVSSDIVKPPRVKEALASFECKVLSVTALGDKGGAGNLVICEVLTAHFKKGLVNDEFQINIRDTNLVGRLGQDYYTVVNRDSLFQVEKLSGKLGLGWDKLPKEILESKYLTGNEIAKLSNIDDIPLKITTQKISKDPEVYKKVKKLIKKNLITEAWNLMFS